METEPILHEPSTFETEITTEILERYTSLSIQILAEPIQVGSESLRFETHKYINFIWNKQSFR
jgi:hypothetical protein